MMKIEIDFTEDKVTGMVLGGLAAGCILILGLGFIALFVESPGFALFIATVLTIGGAVGWRKGV